MKSFHISRIAQHLLLLVTLPTLVVAFMLFTYTVISNYEYNRATIASNQETILGSIDDHVHSIEKTALDSVQSMDFLYFSNTSSKNVATVNSDKLLAQLQRSMSIYKEVVGVVLYNSVLDQSFSSYFSTDFSGMDSLVPVSNTPLTEHRDDHLELAEYEGQYFLLYVVRQRYGYMTIIICPSNNENYRTLNRNNYEDSLFFSSESAALQERNYIASKLESAPLFLSYKIENYRTFTGISVFQIIAILVLGLLFLSIILLFRFMQKFLLSPLSELSASFKRITDGDTNYRIGKSSNIVEFATFYKGFDAMLDSLHAAEIENYQHQEEAAKAKMQYLQMQIRPHFYLNCLKTINFLAQIHEDEKIQSIVISLSDYFRYSFQDQNQLVTFREEMHSVGSYIDLCRCLYSAIRLELDIPEEAMEIPCLPLTILTFVENCVKHRNDSDEILIRITASVNNENSEKPMLELCIQNSSRFDDEVLATLNAATNDEFQYRSNKIGISNVRYRMWLFYKEDFNIEFTNKDDLATVSMTFPTVPGPDSETRLL